MDSGRSQGFLTWREMLPAELRDEILRLQREQLGPGSPDESGGLEGFEPGSKLSLENLRHVDISQPDALEHLLAINIGTNTERSIVQ